MLPPGFGALKYPAVLGFELVGTVVAVGAGVQAFVVGEVVAALECHGGMTTHIELPAAVVFPCHGVDKSAAVSVVMGGVLAYQLLHRVSAGRLAKPADAT